MSPPPRLFVKASLSHGSTLSLGSDAANYLMRVLRLAPGAAVRVFNGRDGEWLATIDSAGNSRVELALVEAARPQPPKPALSLILLFAPVKKEATDFIIEKATELGARVIRPVLTERTQTRTVRTDRFRRNIIEAAEQTERLDLPELLEAETLTRALAALEPDVTVLFCDEAGGGEAIARVAEGLSGAVAILIGPEGGFTPFERAGLKARANTVAVDLGPRILARGDGGARGDERDPGGEGRSAGLNF